MHKTLSRFAISRLQRSSRALQEDPLLLQDFSAVLAQSNVEIASDCDCQRFWLALSSFPEGVAGPAERKIVVPFAGLLAFHPLQNCEEERSDG